MFTFLKGKKTYIVAAGMVAYAVLGFVLGQIGANEAMLIAFNGLGFAGIRSGIAGDKE